MMAAVGQCENDPIDRPMGLVDRDNDSRVTPAMRTRAPPASGHRMDCLDSGTASSSANSRYVVSSGSTRVSSRLPIDQAASNWPATMHAIPASHRGLRIRSVMMRRLRKRDSGSFWAAYC